MTLPRMVCVHDEEGMKGSKDRLTRARAYLDSKSRPEHYVADDLELVKRMLSWLTSTWSGEIKIIGDQWFGVEYSQWEYGPEEEDKPKKVSRGMVECDDPIDGIAAIFEEYVMNDPKKEEDDE